MTRPFKSQRWVPYVFVSPFVISVLAFYVYPMIQTTVMSFQEVLPGMTEFIGLDNFRRIFGLPQFSRAFQNNLIYTALTIAVLIPVPMVLAVLLNSSHGRSMRAFRGMLFLPALLSVVVVGTVFRLMFASTPISIANTVSRYLGFPPQQWLFAGRAQAMFLLVLIATWRWTGVNIVYFLSALQQIPNDLYESADIDGAGPIQKFRHITVPLISPTTIFVTTISIFGGFAMFEESFILWGASSPNNVGLTMVGMIYRQGFQSGRLGAGSAVGLVLLGVVFVISLTFLRFTGFFRIEKR